MKVVLIPAGKLHAAISWLNDHGYYSPEELANDRCKANAVCEHNNDDSMIQCDFRRFPPLSIEDEMLFKLTWGGK